MVKKVRIAICDDEVQCRTQAFTAIRNCMPGDALVDPYKDGKSFLQAFSKKPYDLVFLDIEMPEMDGITVARQLRQLHKDVPIVFLTSHIEFALDGYEVNALRYLTKPINLTKLREVLAYVAGQMQERRVLWIKNDWTEEKVHINDILFMEAQNQNIAIHTKKTDYTVRYNLSDYENELKEDGFFRIHRGYLVALGHIKSVGKHELTLADGTVLPVSRSKEKELKDSLFQYIRKEAF